MHEDWLSDLGKQVKLQDSKISKITSNSLCKTWIVLGLGVALTVAKEAKEISH